MLGIKDEYDVALDEMMKDVPTIALNLRVGDSPWEIIHLSARDRLSYTGVSRLHNLTISVDRNSGQSTIRTFDNREFSGKLALTYPVCQSTKITAYSPQKIIPQQVKGKRLRRGDVVQKPFYVQESKRSSRKHY